MAIYHLTVRVGSRTGGQSAAAKRAYIAREGRYSRDADEVLHTESGHMPEWAADGPAAYWDGADLHERANGRLYREIEFALPVELSLDQQTALAHDFATSLTEGECLPYTLAIHRGRGTNPHAHLMVSERQNDGLERPAEMWFRRYNAKKPEQGGARKSTTLVPKSWLQETRAAWSEHGNRALEAAGHAARIDHRTLEAQGVDRAPGIHIGTAVRGMEARGVRTDRVDLALAEVAEAEREAAAAAERQQAEAEQLEREAAAERQAEAERQVAMEREAERAAAIERAEREAEAERQAKAAEAKRQAEIAAASKAAALRAVESGTYLPEPDPGTWRPGPAPEAERQATWEKDRGWLTHAWWREAGRALWETVIRPRAERIWGTAAAPAPDPAPDPAPVAATAPAEPSPIDTEYAQRRDERARAAAHARTAPDPAPLPPRKALAALLSAHGVQDLTAKYEGLGDEGGVYGLVADPPGSLPDDLVAEAEDLVWQSAHAAHPGFHQGDGGHGTLTWTPAGAIDLQHHDGLDDAADPVAADAGPDTTAGADSGVSPGEDDDYSPGF